MNALQSIGEVARHELRDSVRSRRFIVLLILYFMGSLAASLLFVSVLGQIENQLESAIGVAESRAPGGAVSILWQDRQFQEIVGRLVGDRELAMELLGFPPLALFYGWLSFTLVPLLVMLLSSPTIARDVWSGAARFVLFRTSRSSWCIGKLVGQAGPLLVALWMSALAAWIVGYWKLASFEPWPVAVALLLLSFKVWIYAIAFLGLAIGVSQLVKGPYQATALGLVALIGLSILGGVARRFAGGDAGRVWELVNMIVPSGHRLDLWRSDPGHVLPAIVFLFALASLYMLLGHLFFARRDV